MQVLLLATLAAVALADVKPFKSRFSRSSYGLPVQSVTVSPPLLNYKPTSPSPYFRLPIFEPREFGAQITNDGSFGLSTPAPFLNTGFQFSTPAPPLDLNSGLISSTPAPILEGFSTAAPLGIDTGAAAALGLGAGTGAAAALGLGAIQSSTAAPLVDISTAGFSTAAPLLGGSTPLPNLDLGSSTAAPLLGSSVAPNFVLNFGINSYASQSPLFSSLFSSTGLGNFGVSTISPAYSYQANDGGEVQKNVYFFAAPDEPEVIQPNIKIATHEPARKNINYIFVKAPTPARISSIKVKAPSQQRDKTVVYVLVKKSEQQQDIEIDTPEPEPAQKPEVYFIKYRNQQEAEEAIHKVQAGQPNPSEQTAATDLGDNTNFVSNLDKGNSVAQPILNYVKSANFQGLPELNSGLGLFYSTTAAPLLNSESISSSFPQLSSYNFGSRLALPTSGPILPNANQILSTFSSTPAPLLQGLPELSSIHFGSGLSLPTSGPLLPDSSQNLLESQFSSTTIAPDTLLSSTIAPSITSSPVPFANYGPPLLKKKKK